jgi:hypothetical protein
MRWLLEVELMPKLEGPTRQQFERRVWEVLLRPPVLAFGVLLQCVISKILTVELPYENI